MRYSIINYLRGFSIFTIVFMHLLMSHLSGVWHKAILFGGAGVHVFILCSGFGLYLSYLRKPLGYKDFLQRRFRKVYVPYIIAVLLWGIWFQITNDEFPLRYVLSHLFLYKMFSAELDISICYPYWFISTIFQFYLLWPLIVLLYRKCNGKYLFLLISICWSTIVGYLDLQDNRAWGSFFLQYLWEFGLGMWLAEMCFKAKDNEIRVMDAKNIPMKLVLGMVGGMSASALLAWEGGLLKLYNDIPSLIGYLSLALIIYKLGIKWINRFFERSNRFSYELYLLHSLVFVIVSKCISQPLILNLIISIVMAYIIAWGYNLILRTLKLNR